MTATQLVMPQTAECCQLNKATVHMLTLNRLKLGHCDAQHMLAFKLSALALLVTYTNVEQARPSGINASANTGGKCCV